MTTTKHTPGPWHWRVSRKGKVVHLIATDGMGTFVMGFDRFGMSGAQPSFNADGRMQSASDLAVDIPGQEHNNTWNQTLAHPDARIIAAAPDLLSALETLLEDVGVGCSTKARDLARAAIAKAKGTP